jgi:hypothetical protein
VQRFTGNAGAVARKERRRREKVFAKALSITLSACESLRARAPAVPVLAVPVLGGHSSKLPWADL